MFKAFINSIIQDDDYFTYLGLITFALVVVITSIYISQNNNNKESESGSDKKHIKILIQDDTLDSIITDDSEENKFKINYKEKKNVISKTIIEDPLNNSLIQIKYTSKDYKSINLKPHNLNKKFDNIFFKIAHIIDSDINSLQNYNIDKLINKFKRDKNYAKHYYFYNNNDSITLEVILNFQNTNKSEINNKLTNTNIINKNIDLINSIINQNTKKELVSKMFNNITDSILNISNVLDSKNNIKKNTPTENLNKFIENINQSINQSLLNASTTKDRIHLNKAKQKVHFRSLFIKTNKLLESLQYIKDKNEKYLIQKKIDINKNKLNTLYKDILST